MPTPSSPPSRVLVLSLCLGAALSLSLSLAGCGDEEPAPVVDPTPSKTPEEIAKEREQLHLERLRQRFTRAQQQVEAAPEAFQDHIQNFEMLSFEAKDTILEEPVMRALAAQKQSREDHAASRLAELMTRVEELVGQAYYDDAENLLVDEFDPEEIYQGTAAEKERDRKIDWVQRAQAAKVEHGLITTRAMSYKRQGGIEELAKAVAILESYSDEYQGTPYYDEVREMIDEYMTAYLAEKARLAKTEDVEWTSLPVDPYLSSFRASRAGDTDVWTAEGDEIVGNNTGEGPAMIEIGDDDWTSFVVELEVKVPAGQELHIGVTIKQRVGNSPKLYDVETFDPENSSWMKMLIEFRDGRVKMSNIDTLEPLVEPYTPRTAGEGGVAFFLSPSESIGLRNVRVKVLSRAGNPEESGSDGGSDDDGG